MALVLVVRDVEQREMLEEVLPGVYVIEYGDTLTGVAAHYIYVASPPVNAYEQRWIDEYLRPRLLPGAELVTGLFAKHVN